MGKYEDLDRMAEQGNGYLQTAVVLKSNISKTTLAKYVKARGLHRVAFGVYMSEDAWPDDYYLFYLRNKRIVFSLESALYLHNLTDREPSCVTVTVPKNYNSSHISKQGVHVIHIKPDWYDIGMTSVKTYFGNTVPVYDRERTICDVIRFKKDIEIQTFQTAMREYMSSRGKNVGNLIRYARVFGVEDAVRTYTEVLL